MRHFAPRVGQLPLLISLLRFGTCSSTSNVEAGCTLARRVDLIIGGEAVIIAEYPLDSFRVISKACLEYLSLSNIFSTDFSVDLMSSISISLDPSLRELRYILGSFRGSDERVLLPVFDPDLGSFNVAFPLPTIAHWSRAESEKELFITSFFFSSSSPSLIEGLDGRDPRRESRSRCEAMSCDC